MDINQDKIENAILFFANKSSKKTIEKLKLMKFIWLSDRIHLNKYGRLILNDRYKALPHGPIASRALELVGSSLEGKYNVHGKNITATHEFDEDFFSKSDLKVMNYVWEKFKDKTPWSLRQFSHKFPEWIRFEKELSNENLPNSYDMVIQDFFDSPNLDLFSDILTKEDIENSKEHFNVHCTIQGALKG